MNSVPDTQLGLTTEEIALLRHHQQAVASANGSSSRAASRASSQGVLLLDASSLQALARHFDRLMQQIQQRLDYLSDQSNEISDQQYDKKGNMIDVADSQIARFHDILRQIDELEVDFDRIRHIREIVIGYRNRVDEMDKSLPNNGDREMGILSTSTPVRLESRTQTEAVPKTSSGMNAKREQSTEEHWLALKPYIKQVYVNENQTLKQVKEYLSKNYGFAPTSRQLKRRIIDWGFDKNYKQKERPAIRTIGEDPEEWLRRNNLMPVLSLKKDTTTELNRNTNWPVNDHQVAQSVVPPTDSGYASIPKDLPPTTKDTQAVDGSQGTEDFHPSPQMEEDSQDTRTLYSDSASLPSLQKESYISALSRDLRHRLNLEDPTRQTAGKITEALPELLKAFALKVGYNASDQMRRDVMWFIYKYRNEIAKGFETASADDEESLPDIDAINLDKILPEEKVELWRQKLNYPLEKPQRDVLSQFDSKDRTESIDNYEEEEIGETNMPGIAEYQSFLFKLPAYEWLVATVQREVTLAPADVDVMKSIGNRITRFLLSITSTNKISRKKSPVPYKIRFEIPWDPAAFVKEQGYDEEPERAIELALTLTGSARSAQALACVEYMHQTWSTAGDRMIQLIRDVVHNRRGQSGRGIQRTILLPDDTKIIAWMNAFELNVAARGTVHSIAEVGTQLAWLGAALRSSPKEVGVVYCTPYISDIRGGASSQMTGNGIPACRIDFDVKSGDDISGPVNGECWHNMFRNPVVVKGYPIRNMGVPNSGLEIPLNVIAGLVNTQRADSFGGQLYIKGFSSMLVPMKRHGDTLIWHLLHNPDGSRISYLDNSIGCKETVSFHDLTNVRHVVGWCSEVRNYAGAADAKYNVQRSRLPEPPSGSVLEKITITGGQFITGGAEFCLGRRDSPVHVSRNNYIPQLKWISKKFVVFWDEADKIGWLVNGTSALLHLVRASLEHDSTDKFSSEFLFKREEMQESREPYTAASALEVLLNDANKKLPIYAEKEGFIRFEDRVEHIYNILEKLIDHQIDVARQSGLKVKPRARKYLEGWEFKDLATDQDPFYPRVATLPTVGKGWVDFTRAIHAVNLFGCGFGEMIRPADSNKLCSHWGRVPVGKYYLAACAADIKEIMEVEGNPDSNPMKLSRDVIWHNPNMVFDTCQCMSKTKTKRSHSDLIQVLLPSRFSKLIPRRAPITLQNHGAVLFGHNWSFNWHWKDHGDPVEGTPPAPSEEIDSVFYDSGIGSSPSSGETVGSPNITRTPSAEEDSGIILSDHESSTSLQLGNRTEAMDSVVMEEESSRPDTESPPVRHGALPRRILKRLRDSYSSDPNVNEDVSNKHVKRH